MAALAKQFKIYATCNTFRYITIGILILISNDLNTNDVTSYEKFCCDCYYVSLKPTEYGIRKGERFDLSRKLLKQGFHDEDYHMIHRWIKYSI